MRQIDPTSLTQRENYKLLIGSVIPRPVAIVTTQSETGILNIAPFSFFTIVSSDPPILSIAIQRKNGESKDTARNLIATNEAVIHILDQSNVVAANQAAAQLPSGESELTVADFTTVPSATVDVLGLKEAKVRFETKLYQHVPILEGSQVDLLLLQITAYHIDETVYQDGKIDPNGLQAVSRLAGNTYATIGDMFDIKRPD
ncbi:flavin reductase family protein [Enterococcus sp. DIV0876]|uniref:flavin reductase family protein n=1 Tax=Enterococcus sp. DIV0876 TaxID=2774633 RepID=UPI003D2FED3A